MYVKVQPVCEGLGARARCLAGGARARAAARLLACEGCSLGLTGKRARRSSRSNHI